MKINKSFFLKIWHILRIYNCWRACKSYKPLYVELILTSRCNFVCAMCNIWKIGKKQPELFDNELSTEQIVSILRELSELGTEEIFVSGGEPTMREDLPYIIKCAKDNNIQVHLVTNGSLITEKLAKELINAGLDKISFSIEGHTPEIHENLRKMKGSWEKAVGSIGLINSAKDTLKAKNPSINISQILSRTNYRYIEEMLELKSKWQYDTINFQPIVWKVPGCENFILRDDDLNNLQSRLPFIETKICESGLSKSTILPLLSLCMENEDAIRGHYSASFNKKVLCFAPWKMATIDPFGNIYPCCFACTFQNLSEDLKHSFWGKEDFCMGNIKNECFKQVWEGEKYNQFRKVMQNPPTYTMCKWCNYRSFSDAVLTGLFKDRSLLLGLFHKNYGTQKLKERE